jgi:hypothetical protein
MKAWKNCVIETGFTGARIEYGQPFGVYKPFDIEIPRVSLPVVKSLNPKDKSRLKPALENRSTRRRYLKMVTYVAPFEDEPYLALSFHVEYRYSDRCFH